MLHIPLDTPVIIQTLWVGFVFTGIILAQGNIPPRIISETLEEIIFEAHENITLHCTASGTPEIGHKWYKNDFPFLNTTSAAGQLTIVNAEVDDEGAYKCEAYNQYGRTITATTALRMAFMDPWPYIMTPISVKEGSTLTLNCTHPDSYPPPIIFWTRAQTVESNMDPASIEFGSRIQMDDSGNLYFSNVMMEDGGKSSIYKCHARNSELDMSRGGSYYNITVLKERGRLPSRSPPKLLFSSPDTTVVAHQDVHLKCLFSGSPSPRLAWHGPGQRTYEKRNHGTEIFFDDIAVDESGNYTCIGSDGKKKVQKTIQLRVEEEPYITEHPRNMTVYDDGIATFRCEGAGIPTPDVTWKINGFDLHDLGDLKTRHNITETDDSANLNIQCNDEGSATLYIKCLLNNTHGVAVAEAFLFIQVKTSTQVIPTTITSMSTTITFTDVPHAKLLHIPVKLTDKELQEDTLSTEVYSNITDSGWRQSESGQLISDSSSTILWVILPLILVVIFVILFVMVLCRRKISQRQGYDVKYDEVDMGVNPSQDENNTSNGRTHTKNHNPPKIRVSRESVYTEIPADPAI